MVRATMARHAGTQVDQVTAHFVACKYYLLDTFCSQRPLEHGPEITSTDRGTFCSNKFRSVTGHASRARPGRFTPGTKTPATPFI
jgi:hypothetical protein